MAFMNNLHSVLLVLGFSGESKGILGLAVGDLVNPEPFVGSTDEAWKVSFNILNIVELGSQGVLDIDDDDLPIGFAFVKKSHDPEDLDLLDLTNISDLLADLADI